MSEKPKMSFQEWIEQLNAHIKALGIPNWPEITTEDDGWRDYYDDDYTPKDAFEEDCSYGL